MTWTGYPQAVTEAVNHLLANRPVCPAHGDVLIVDNRLEFEPDRDYHYIVIHWICPHCEALRLGFDGGLD